MLKTCIVGSGAISKTHAEALKSVADTKIVAFCDEKIERAVTRTEEYGGNAYSSLTEMIDLEKPDVLHICTPHYLHVPMAIEALKKNINVMMEKPPAISHEQFDELMTVQSNSSASLGICFQNRYNGSVAEAKGLLESGELGKVLGARGIVTWCRGGVYYTESGWRGQLAKEGGGVLINQSIHTLDLMTYLLGKPERVTATSANFHLKGVIDEEDTVNAFLEYGDKTAIFFATTANCKDSPIILDIFCEKGTLRIEGNSLKITYPDNTSTFKDYATRLPSGKACWGTSHTLLIKDYYNSITGNSTFPVTLESTIPSFETMMAVYDSAKSKKSLRPGELI